MKRVPLSGNLREEAIIKIYKAMDTKKIENE